MTVQFTTQIYTAVFTSKKENCSMTLICEDRQLFIEQGQNDESMLPPRKIYRVGTEECKEALHKKIIEISLPDFQNTSDDITSTVRSTRNRTSSSLVGVVQDEVFADEEDDDNDDDDDDECDDDHRNNYSNSHHHMIIHKNDSVSREEETGDASSNLQPNTDQCLRNGSSESDKDENDAPAAIVSQDEDSSSSSAATMNEEDISCSVHTPALSPSMPKYQQPDPSLPRFSDIIGHGPVKLRIEEVLLPIALPVSIASSVLTGIRSMPASILFYGPPGVGKTKLARAIAGEAQAAFLSVGPSDVLSKYVGESEASVKGLFQKAYKQAQRMESKCAVLFFDEIDALGQSRGGSGREQGGGAGDSCSRRVLAELLIQLNQISSPSQSVDENYPHRSDDEVENEERENENSHEDQSAGTKVIVVAATNRPGDCDPALLRRFGIRVHVGLPNEYDRRRILKRLLKGIVHTITKVELRDLASALEGWSGSELESLAREAAMAPVRECIRAAAKKKRRASRPSEQSCGDHCGQRDGAETRPADPNQQARDCLLAGFRTMRPVNLSDFEAAIEFSSSSSGHQETDDEGVNAVDESARKRKLSHYDSSSDSEEDV